MKPEPLYRIKPLEWKRVADFHWVGNDEYVIRFSTLTDTFGVWFTDDLPMSRHFTLNEAQAAAQNHYEQRVKECLIEVQK